MRMWTVSLALALMCMTGSLATNGDIEWENLHVTFGVIGGYYNIPLTLAELVSADSNYVFMTTDSDLNVDFYSYPNDPRVSIGFDSYGSVAAVRMALPKAGLDNRAISNGVAYNFTYDDKPVYTSGNYWDTEVYYSTALFTSPETLAAGGRSATNGLVGENVYLPIDGEYSLMPRYECDAVAAGFNKGGCFDGMGIHYIQGMSTSMACEDHQGPFLIYADGDLVSLGWFPFGTFTSTSDRTWFEDPPATLTSVFAPNAPDCFESWADQYGVISFHIFLKNNPRFTVCSLGANDSACD